MTPMSGKSTDVDVAVVGAGAAGIGAARRLLAHGRSVLVLEARDRIGGRAQTVTVAGGIPIDLGCGWLHSADHNPLTALAREMGFAIDEALPTWGERLRRHGLSDREQADWQRTRNAFWRRLDRALDKPDCAASELLQPDSRWNAMLDAISTWVSGAELEHVSAHDLALYEDSGVNWRVVEGYGAMVAALGRELPVRLRTPVRRIDWSDAAGVALETDAGTVRAAAAIVTIPPAILAAGAIRFLPELPPEKLAAAHGLPLGADDKLFLGLPDDALPEIGANCHLIGAVDRTETGSYQIRPHGRPVIEAFFGGRLAHELERAGGEAAMMAFACDELAGLFGDGIRTRLKPLAASAWSQDEWARGAYSFALPGHAGDRATLAAPLAGRLFFAGEACHPKYFSTAHGAFESGITAADQALQALSPGPHGM
jgi:monoamine oxidase